MNDTPQVPARLAVKPVVQRLMDLARHFRAAPATDYDVAYKELETFAYGVALGARSAEAMPADLLRMRQQLEQEWSDLRALQAASEGARSAEAGVRESHIAELIAFAKTAPGRLPSRVQEAITALATHPDHPQVAAVVPKAQTDPNSREAQMVTLRMEDGKATVWCDPEIADLVDALNTDKLATIASCSGHGHRPGSIALKDGRWLFVATEEQRQVIEATFPVDVNGAAERETLRKAQAIAVMPLIGPLLDAWECSSQTCREELPELDKQLRLLNRAMEDATPAPREAQAEAGGVRELTEDEAVAVDFYRLNPSAALCDLLRCRLSTPAPQAREPAEPARWPFEVDADLRRALGPARPRASSDAEERTRFESAMFSMDWNGPHAGLKRYALNFERSEEQEDGQPVVLGDYVYHMARRFWELWKAARTTPSQAEPAQPHPCSLGATRSGCEEKP